VRVFARDPDGGLRWLGEDDLPPTSPGGRLRLRLGGTTGISGEHKQVEYSLDHSRKRIIEEIEINLKNDSAMDAEVTVLERMFRGDTWKISWSSPTFVKDDTRSVRASIVVPAGKTETVRYRVIWSWR
jgi:hypothetical protein